MISKLRDGCAPAKGRPGFRFGWLIILPTLNLVPVFLISALLLKRGPDPFQFSVFGATRRRPGYNAL